MKLAAIVLAGLAATGLASCPNQCSGHGKCTDNDVCECYKQSGTTWRQRAGYSGADCSQRTCPLGTAFGALQTNTGDSTSVKFTEGLQLGDGLAGNAGVAGLKVVVNNYKMGKSRSFNVRFSAENTWQWKLSDASTYSAASETSFTACTNDALCELTGAGSGTADTGVYIYTDSATAGDFADGNVYEFTVDHQEGADYFAGNSNSAHMQVECSGRGSCDRASGRCGCFDGFSGEACQRTTCANDCSGHGVCQSQNRFVYDALGASSYTGYDGDKEMGCLCDGGFRGPDCSQIECPSGADPMGGNGGTEGVDCSGRGLCDYSAGLCTCFKGFYGERCEYQTNFV